MFVYGIATVLLIAAKIAATAIENVNAKIAHQAAISHGVTRRRYNMKVIGDYVVVKHRNGRQKAIPIDRYRRFRRIRSICSVLGAIGSMLLICGATYDMNRPETAYAVMIQCVIAILLLIACIVAAVGRSD